MGAITVAVIGAGAIGSATALALAEQKVDVTVFDRYTPPHAFGAHAGESRLLRTLPYLEKTAAEMTLLTRGLEGWESVERRSGRHLITRCGGLIIGASFSEQLAKIRATRSDDTVVLSPEDLRSRFPQFHAGPDQSAVLDPRGGIIDPAAAVEATLQLALSHGARVQFDTRVRELRPLESGVEVLTDHERRTFDRVVVATGAFSGEIEPDLPVRARRLLLGWFRPQTHLAHLLPQCPSFVWAPGADQFVYGGPSYDASTLKVGIDWDWGYVDDPGIEGRELEPEDREAMRATVTALLPWLDPRGDRFEMHIDGWTNDKMGYLGERAGRPNIILATAWSGYGFKLAPALGAVAAGLALGVQPDVDITPLSPNRTSKKHSDIRIP